MEIIIKRDGAEVCRLGARLIARLVRKKPDAVLGLATGATTVDLYKELIRMHKDEDLDFSRVTTFNLDEYLGLTPHHPCSYHHFMRTRLFDHINVPPEQINVPDGQVTDVPQFCEKYEERIQASGGIDLQLLGIGSDGHIGFNEPTSSLSSRTRIKTLTQETVDANKRYFPPEEEVPRHVITMGVGTIMDAKCCLVLAYGHDKADAVQRMVEGPISAMVPATVLQMHCASIVVVDEAASKGLVLADYYRHVYKNKPKWQQYE